MLVLPNRLEPGKDAVISPQLSMTLDGDTDACHVSTPLLSWGPTWMSSQGCILGMNAGDEQSQPGMRMPQPFAEEDLLTITTSTDED